MGFTVDISGDLGARLDEITAELKQVLKDELYAFGLDTVAEAKQLCPVDEGTMRNQITFDQLPEPEIGVELIAGAPYSAYVEFGTGIFAAEYVPSLPPEFQQFAMTFYVDGSGRLPAQPFLYPAFEHNRVLLLQRLKATFNA